MNRDRHTNKPKKLYFSYEGDELTRDVFYKYIKKYELTPYIFNIDNTIEIRCEYKMEDQYA